MTIRTGVPAMAKMMVMASRPRARFRPNPAPPTIRSSAAATKNVLIWRNWVGLVIRRPADVVVCPESGEQIGNCRCRTKMQSAFSPWPQWSQAAPCRAGRLLAPADAADSGTGAKKSNHLRNTGPMLSSLRCGAKTRSGKPCIAPAVSGKRRCRMHGGAPGSGAPPGNKNALKNGRYTREAIQQRRQLQALLRQSRILPAGARSSTKHLSDRGRRLRRQGHR